MMRTALMLLMVTVINVTTAGCGAFSFLLPVEKTWTESPWKNFEEARDAFDRIEPRKTSSDELKESGFDPYVNHNIAVLTYMDVFNKFVPNSSISLADQDPAIQECFQARNRCTGLKVVVRPPNRSCVNSR